MLSWLSILGIIIVSILAIILIWWLYKEDYITWEFLSWDVIKDSFKLDSVKDLLVTIFSQPIFLFLYGLFILLPLWVIGPQFISIPIWYKIILTVAGIWAVDRVMVSKDLK